MTTLVSSNVVASSGAATGGSFASLTVMITSTVDFDGGRPICRWL